MRILSFPHNSKAASYNFRIKVLEIQKEVKDKIDELSTFKLEIVYKDNELFREKIEKISSEVAYPRFSKSVEVLLKFLSTKTYKLDLLLSDSILLMVERC